MNLTNLKRQFADFGCQKLFVKELSPNDNSKNQIYLGGSFEVLNILPITSIKSVEAGDWKRERFKASLNFSWITPDGILCKAPFSQLILYPKYPEVRFSGFLKGCEKSPSDLLNRRLTGRLLFLSVTPAGSVVGFVTSGDTEIAQEYFQKTITKVEGVFKVIELDNAEGSRERLLSELYRVHKLGWIKSKRLDNTGAVLPCLSPNCGGYTLEAELGITPNGYSEPDFLGWEVKQFGVKKLNRINSSVITLMTPEPNGGVYTSEGVEAFIRRFGYNDLRGRTERMNFGGIHIINRQNQRTGLTLIIDGFDHISGRIRKSDGQIALIDSNGTVAASWSFPGLILHWNRKHNQACFVPSLSEKTMGLKYRYGSQILLGQGTDFQLYLSQMANGNIYYDPGIKLENMSSTPRVKRRSQFRISSKHLHALYRESELVELGDN